MIRRVVLVLLTLSTGGFMIVDGTRNLFTGTYFGSTLGPWSNLVRATGLDPHHFGAVFVILGLAWFVALAGLLMEARWAIQVAAAVGVLTLWYLPVGTVLSLLYLILLFTTRAGPRPAENHKI